MDYSYESLKQLDEEYAKNDVETLQPTQEEVKGEKKHHPDLILCRKQAGIHIGKVCETCEGRCVICDSHVRLSSLVRICDDCNFGKNQEDVLYVEHLELPMPIIVKNVSCLKKIEMDVLK